MNKFIGKAGMVLIGWMVGSGILWADQTTREPLLQNTKAIAGPVSANESVSSLGNITDPTGGIKNEGKSIKISDGSSQKSSTKTKKLSSKKSKKSTPIKSKKSKTGKSKKKAKAQAGIDMPLAIG